MREEGESGETGCEDMKEGEHGEGEVELTGRIPQQPRLIHTCV